MVRALLFLGVLGSVVIAARILPAREFLLSLRQHITDVGPWGGVGFVFLYVVATNLGISGVPLVMGAGVMFGFLWGSVVSIVASTLSAGVMFLIARHLGQSAFAAWFEKREAYRWVNSLLQHHGAWVVGLARLMPFPFMVLNYSLGLTAIPFRTYILWSAVGMIPMNLLFVSGGDAAARWLQGGDVPWWILGVMLGLGGTGFLAAWFAKRRLG